MFSSDELVFAWPIGKALLIVIVACGILVYAAWAGTKRTLRSSGKHKFPVRVGRKSSVHRATLHRSDSAKVA
jgi:hypothetical protein